LQEILSYYIIALLSELYTNAHEEKITWS